MNSFPRDHDVVVALDVGGTGLKGALVDASGSVRDTEHQPTPRELGPDAVVDAVVELAAKLAGRGRVVGCGLAVPGIVDSRAGIARYSANIGWRDVPLRDLVANRLGVPVGLDHDVRTGAVAEGRLGAARDVDDYLFLTIGTGIAGAVVLGGELYPGVTASGGELGHAAVYPDGEPCACGGAGCLETYASAAAVTRRYAAAGGEPNVPAEDVIARAGAGDPAAGRVWDEAVDALAVSLAGYTLLLDPALVVLGGGLASSGDALVGPLTARMTARLAFREPPAVTTARLGSRATMLGAAILAWRAIGGS